MNEIRFSNPVKKEEEMAQTPALDPSLDKKTKSSGAGKKIIKTFLILVFLVVAIFAFTFGRDLVSGFMSNEKNEWSAIFLTNGQVYFGKIDSNSKREMVLKNVYYLQASSPEQSVDSLNQSTFKLVKLGSELHGPKDILMINKDNIVFYEYLREDSKVVESIKNFK